jgi:NADH-quinone oxidoreductase subunit L
MQNLLWLVPVLPLAGFALLALLGRRMPRGLVAWVGAGSVGLAALAAVAIAAEFIAAPPAGNAYRLQLAPWFEVEGFRPRFALYLDALSLVGMLVTTVIGFLIHLYSTEFMLAPAPHAAGDAAGHPGTLSPAPGAPDPSPARGGRETSDRLGYARYFAYLNLFIASMCTLLLADNLLLLYLGWEGVGLCSYLLIGFWYRDPANGAAARKAFVVTRVGDTAFAIGLFLLFTQLGTLDIQPMLRQAAQTWQPGAPLAIAAAALLLGGAVGKSAQLPLQTWLPDAMAGPTPVSALIHAATMVTAGVYLIARTHVLFQLAPPVLLAVAVIGALTLLLAGFSALAQDDLKRVLAYSTISQIGYMFLALGVGAWSAAIFHLMTHAFFKALLFLCAGVMIQAMHEEHDIHRMPGLRRRLPLVFWGFLIGSASLAALPLATAGFFSKDEILSLAWRSTLGHPLLWAAGWVGAILTGVYIFRVVFVVFFDGGVREPRRAAEHPLPDVPADREGAARPGWRITLPLAILCALSIAGGWLEVPPHLGGWHLFSDFMRGALPATAVAPAGGGREATLAVLAALASLGGIGAAWWLFRRNPRVAVRLAQGAAGSALRRWWHAGWGFDRLYDLLLVQPLRTAARLDRDDFIDAPYGAAAAACRLGWRALSATQTGQMRRYAAGIAAGSVLVLLVAVAA